MNCKIKLIIVFMVIGVFISTANASDEWTKTDIGMEITWQVLHLIDWNQTRHIATHPEDYYEINPLIGKHPTTEKVDLIMGISTILHPIITNALPKKSRFLGTKILWCPRATWQSVSIGISAGCVVNNISIGIKMPF